TARSRMPDRRRRGPGFDPPCRRTGFDRSPARHDAHGKGSFSVGRRPQRGGAQRRAPVHLRHEYLSQRDRRTQPDADCTGRVHDDLGAHRRSLLLGVMAEKKREILVGTSSWTDKTLLATDWYPKDAKTAEGRLAYYASQFPLVEVDSSYYALPSEKNAALWVERTPSHFTFNVKAFSLMTQHPAQVRALPKDLRDAAGDKRTVYPRDLDPAVI